jgi:hypothetical protein
MPGDSVAFIDNNNHFAYRYYFQLTADGTRNVPVVIACLKHPLCPATAPRPEQLATTWVLAPQYAIDHLPPAYRQVLDARAQADPSRPDLQTLWHKV